jgi:hypothetical protein
MHATGSPGNWTWEIWDAGVLGTCSLTIADTVFYCYPGQYPSLAHDPISNTILAGYKAYYYKEYAGTICYNGAHIGGIYTTDDGESWTISQPLSDTNTTQIAWADWSVTEVAHHLAHVEGDVWANGIWVNGAQLILYFERGLVTSFLPLAINEKNGIEITHAQLRILPTIGKNRATIFFEISRPAYIKINLYDTSGRRACNILETNLIAGQHAVDLRTHNLPCGLYFVSLESENVTLTKEIILVD